MLWQSAEDWRGAGDALTRWIAQAAEGLAHIEARLADVATLGLLGIIFVHIGGSSGLNFVGFHYFTFNRLQETWAWEQQKRRGRQPSAVK